MRRRILLPIALASLLALVGAASVTNAQVPLRGDGVALDVPAVPSTPGVKAPAGEVPDCVNGVDDDGDGRIDFPQDPGCTSPLDINEAAGGQGTGAGSGGGSTDGGGATAGGDSGGAGGEGGVGSLGIDEESDEVLFEAGEASDRAGRRVRRRALRNADGTPTDANPTLSLINLGPVPIGVPNFMIDRFRIPPFLIPIYQAAGTEYGIRWEVLAAINEIETDYGRNLRVSSAGALGWMQFMPPSWRAYGVDANGDDRKDPYNPVDAIFAAARYLRAAGGHEDLRRAIFAYNHADWYVESVLMRSRYIAGLPPDLIGSLTGLTQGHFPVAASARYADDISEREALARATPSERASYGHNAADVIEASPDRRGIDIYARSGAPVVAVNDGVVKRIGRSARLGAYIVLQDAFGNRYTYSQLGKVSGTYAVPRQRRLSARDFSIAKPDSDPRPSGPASTKRSPGEIRATRSGRGHPRKTDRSRSPIEKALARSLPGFETVRSYFTGVFRFDRERMVRRPLERGAKVPAGAILGRIGRTREGAAPSLHFTIRPAGRGAPRVDPKPILDGWRLLEATAIYRAAGRDPFSPEAAKASIGQVLLMSKEGLAQRVLADPRIEIYACGRNDILAGHIDRRVLAALAYLSESGMRPTVTSLKCGHSVYTKSGNVSHHTYGTAADIAQINGVSILGHQGRGSITEAAVVELLKLQGAMQPAQIITLMEMGGPTYAMADHADHIHVGWQPRYRRVSGKLGREVARILEPGQWERLVSRLSEIRNPRVRLRPSQYALPTRVDKRQAGAGTGE